MPEKRRDPDRAMKSKRPLATALALMFLLLLLTALGTRFWAGQRIIDLAGPTHIAAGGVEVVLFAAGQLFHLSADGRLRSEIPFGHTGLQGGPIDLRFLDDGSLLVAGQRPAVLIRCRLPAWSCGPEPHTDLRHIERQLKVVQGARPGEWLVTDARAGALWRLSPGSPPETLLPAGTLAGPNDLALAGDGALWVADTNHRRIVELVPDEAGVFSLTREHAADNVFLNGPAWYPVMLAE